MDVINYHRKIRLVKWLEMRRKTYDIEGEVHNNDRYSYEM